MKVSNLFFVFLFISQNILQQGHLKRTQVFFFKNYSVFKQFLKKKNLSAQNFPNMFFKFYVLNNRKQTLIAPKYALNFSSHVQVILKST